jgi:hypothetical protein
MDPARSGKINGEGFSPVEPCLWLHVQPLTKYIITRGSCSAELSKHCEVSIC